MKIVSAVALYRWINPYSGEVITSNNCSGIYGNGFLGEYRVRAPAVKRSRQSRHTTAALRKGAGAPHSKATS